ncbi:hypothetical protein [Desulfonema magnum]|uniref:NodB homology domain-containing protein n=1 Tax=Desulfonema magnum TaxID=45655 RepID=A0A975BS04_9BACT|nr:hypothetical protein [Desulfonema magnum]QTA89995.1 Uncharacterized protein dnm_060550 [Desulfonema magnum]
MDRLKMNSAYYQLKPMIPRRFQIWMRSKYIRRKRPAFSNVWPILEKASKPPMKWPGWPDKKKFALVLTHDVDTAKGQKKSLNLMKLEKKLGFRSAFNFVPERYRVSAVLRNHLKSNGFEVGVHGLNHDGKLFQSKEIFQERSFRINHYLKAWDAVGFRSPAMHHNLDWIHDLAIEYDSSTFDTDPFEPQPDGVATIFPFWVTKNSNCEGYMELPYTLPQGFTLFVLMKEKNIAIWKQKLDWIMQKRGMALVNTHPDYMNFDSEKSGFEEYPATYYSNFLNYIKTKYEGQYWHALPREVTSFLTAEYQK